MSPGPLDLDRYRGHLALPEVGLAGQRRLADASVLCVGTGGLGSPAALYLAAAGVGRLGLLDADAVDASNLHRQIVFKTADVGAPKAQTARSALAALNPDVELVVHDQRLDAANAPALLAGYDVILDGTDNFPTRYAINDACVALGKPDVWASVYRFEGQVAVFDATRGPCYRCLFPQVPPDEEIPACAEAGVLGVLPGVLGTVQALEAIKLVLGVGEPLIGRLLVFEALAMRWRELRLGKDPACAACGAEAAPSRPAPARRAEGVPAAPATPVALAPAALRARLAAEPGLVVLDCREPFEFATGHLPGSRLIPLGELAGRLGELEGAAAVVVVCARGPRSQIGAAVLQQAGFGDVGYLAGGLVGWDG